MIEFRRAARRPLIVLTTATLAVGSVAAAGAADAAPASPGKRAETRVGITIEPGKGTYGVGQLVTVRFSQPVTRKAAVERAITVTSRDAALGPGSWAWMDDSTAVYRPKRFWPAEARIRFRLPLAGVVLGRSGDAKLVGEKASYTLRTARSLVLDIRDNRHHMLVKRDGRVVKTFPVSLGKPGWETRSGIKILTDEKYRVLRMQGYDPGLDEHWDVQAPWSIRLTPTGEFIHAAPWALARLGKYNGSHGCTNMAPADAHWLFRRVLPGDPVVTRGTGRPMTTDNGIPGAYWNYSWKQWRTMSALHHGSRAAAFTPAPLAAGPLAGP